MKISLWFQNKSTALALVALCFMSVLTNQVVAQVAYSTQGSTYSQNFDNLFGSVPANNTTTAQATILPTGWAVSETQANADANIRVDNGSSGTGDSYLDGATGSNERALGSYASGSMAVQFGVQLLNNSGTTITSFTVTYDGEQWKDGGSSTAVTNKLTFSYGIAATSLTVGTYVNDTTLDFAAVTNNTTADVTRDGNNAASRTAGITKTITGISWASGATLWLRWTDINDTGNDDNLAIDNFSFSTPAGAATTTTTLAASVNPSTYAQSVTFTATLKTNNVTAANATSNYVFKVDGVAVATNAVSSGSATYIVSSLLSGARSITAEYAGDANYTRSTNTVTQTVNKATTTVTLAVGNSPVSYNGAGRAATVSITASNTPGSVQNILTGVAATQTASGTYAVTANYVPTDTNYTTLTALSAGNFTINKATTTATLAVNNSPVTYNGVGQSAMVSITASNTPGSVQNILTGGAATQTASGTYAVTANYIPADTNYTTLTGLSAGNFTINQAALGVTANSTNKVYDGVPFSGGNGVTYSGFVNSETAAVLGGALSYGGTSQGATNVGGYTIAPSGLTSANYAISYTNGTLTITKATPSFSLVSSANPSGFKDTVSFTANSFAANVTGSVQFTTNGANFGSAVTISSANATSSGTAGLPRGATNVVAAIYSGDANYFSITNALTQTVSNHPPVAANLAATRAAGSTTWKISVADLLTNVTDVDMDTIVLASVSVSTNGATPFIGGGYVLYTNTNLVGDQFTYNVSDGFGGTASALVNLSISTNAASGQAQSIVISGGTATLQFAGIPGFSYNVLRSTNLTDWATILTTNPVAGVFQYTDDFSDLGAVPASAYYRLGWNP